MGKGVVFVIRNFYQKLISPFLSKKLNLMCRFHPSCSEYTILALEKYGFVKGIIKSYKRIRRCKPDNYENCFDLP